MLLVGKMPEEMPPALQVPSQVGSGGVGVFVHTFLYHTSLLLQFKQLSSHQSLLAHIPNMGLPASLGGCLPYSHQAWLNFRMVSVPGGIGRLWLYR